MCFSVEIHITRTEIEERFRRPFKEGSEEFEPRYFFSAFEYPRLPVITQENPNNIELLQWGLIPSWVKDIDHAQKIRSSTLNARAETLLEKPSFRNSLFNKRCLVIVHGFFEYHHSDKEKIPYYIKLKNDKPFGIAGIYDFWKINGNDYIKGFSIITCDANELLGKIHNTKKRMPVILPYDVEDEWISYDKTFNNVKHLLKPIDDNELIAWPINKIDRKNVLSSDLIKPIEKSF